VYVVIHYPLLNEKYLDWKWELIIEFDILLVLRIF
jgi:hypothetical protein